MIRRIALLAGIAALTACGAARTTAKPDGYFEARKNGNTYVFGSVPSMQKYMQTGDVDTTPRYYPGGNTVYFETYGSEALVEAYVKAHP